MKINGYVLLVLTFILMFTTACSTTNINNTSNPKETITVDDLIVARKADANNIDPHFISDNPTSNYVFGKVYEGLIRKNKDLKYEPALAKSWEQPDDVTWIFHLRNDVTFHDGTDFNAQAVKVV